MTDKPNTPDQTRVRALIEQYGADVNHFPAAEREPAAQLIAASPDLQALQQQAAELDGLLALPTVAAPSAELHRRVAEIPLRHPQAAAAPGWLEFLLGGRLSLRLSAAFVVAATLGVVSGLAVEVDADTTTNTTTASADTWDELETVAFAEGLLFEDLDSQVTLEGSAP